MPADTSVAEAVARTVRALRAARSWSLDVLAGRAGVSKGVLVALERGDANPSLGTLIRVSDAFGIALTDLVQVPEQPRMRRVPAARHVVLWHGESGGAGTLVAGTSARPGVELWRWELLPGEARHSEAHAAGCQEIVRVDDGTLTVTVGQDEQRIDAPDAVVFPGDVPHGYANDGAEAVRFTLVVMDV